MVGLVQGDREGGVEGGRQRERRSRKRGRERLRERQTEAEIDRDRETNCPDSNFIFRLGTSPWLIPTTLEGMIIFFH